MGKSVFCRFYLLHTLTLNKFFIFKPLMLILFILAVPKDMLHIPEFLFV